MGDGHVVTSDGVDERWDNVTRCVSHRPVKWDTAKSKQIIYLCVSSGLFASPLPKVTLPFHMTGDHKQPMLDAMRDFYYDIKRMPPPSNAQINNEWEEPGSFHMEVCKGDSEVGWSRGLEAEVEECASALWNNRASSCVNTWGAHIASNALLIN